MNKKSIAALAIAATMTLGAGASSYAWFTSSAKSTANTFQTGTLKIHDTFAGWNSTTDLDNMQPGDTKTYQFTVANTNNSGNVSSLDLRYKNDLTDDNYSDTYSLLKAASFTVSIAGTNATAAQTVDYNGLKTFLATTRTFTGGGDAKSDTYTIVINLPTGTGNDYQGQSGTFTIKTRAGQNTASALNANDSSLDTLESIN